MNRRILQLDGIRGLAILMVLALHFYYFQLQPSAGAWAARIARPMEMFWSGVDLFFVLSGFLICGILLDNRESPNYFKAFYVRRCCRILPVYFAFLAAFVILRATVQMPLLFNDATPLWSYPLFLQNFFMGAQGNSGGMWLGVSWSLAIEEQFYFVLPALVWLLPRRALLPLFAACIAASPILRHYSATGINHYVATHMRMDGLLSGAALAVLMRERRFAAMANRFKGVAAVALCLMLAVTAAAVVRPILGTGKNHVWFTALYTLLLLVALTDGLPAMTRLLKARLIVWFGTLSYGLYLLHQPVNILAHWLIAGKSNPTIGTWGDAGITLLAIGFTLSLAALSFRYFETPLLKWGHGFKYASIDVPVARIQKRPDCVSV